LPHGFGQWSKLETLSLLIIGDKNSSIAELEGLNLLTGGGLQGWLIMPSGKTRI
jgi:hypothetical protein